MATRTNQVTAFMLYMYNAWNDKEAVNLFGNDLGMHLYNKWAHYREKGLGDLFWYSELDGTRRKEIIQRAINLYGDEAQEEF